MTAKRQQCLQEWDKVSRVAAHFALPRRTLQHWAEQGVIPVLQPGGAGTLYLIHAPSIARMLVRAKSGPPGL